MKKLLCLILSVVMAFSCFGICMTASAAEYYERPVQVSRVIDPILTGFSTEFAKGISKIGYDSSNVIVTKDAIKNRIENGATGNFYSADDKMFGINIDFLYSKDKSAFTWDYCKYELSTAADTHQKEVDLAESENRKSTCQAKGWYDACSAVLYGYEYEYDSKSVDTQIFEDIIEVKSTIFNEKTRKNEAHYSYYYFLDEGQFALMRSNSNYILNKLVTGTLANGKIYANKNLANANAVKLANFIGNLLYPDFDNIPEGTKVFNTNDTLKDDIFFRAVAELSGLGTILQSNWIDAPSFNVKEIMKALGVSTDDNVILDVELEKGEYMGARILSDMFRNFLDSPMGYLANIVQNFSRNYASYSKAIQSLFIMKFPEIVGRSRETGSKVDAYDGFELTNAEGFFNFLVDTMYFERIDRAVDVKDKLVDERAELVKKGASQAEIRAKDAEIAKAEAKILEETAERFTLAPMPVVRFANAKNMNELYLYLLCYFDINRACEDNINSINKFIDKSKLFFEANYTSETKSTDISNMMTIFKDIFTGTLTMPAIRIFYLGIVTADVIVSFPNNFMSNIKNAIANLIQSFLTAMNNFRNLLFGWTDGLFDKNK